MLRQFFLIASFVGALAALYYLYQRQLGAISFFLLSIFFFSLAVNQLSRQPDQKQGNRERSESDSEKK
ncbi:hypothetical protein CVD25_16415 [Bacillus canaveralius]|uniref:Uncharacterized protein n=1 Tax=Bacillus canaveralius TaxID=1403243 RepID=A0A2N5GGB0_9BACI|nr:hypothetical protein CU635_21285 [Bacillus canaveralius]PLR85501.1 hypothetical protein CVD23_09005 [Bacillus sp. V33-4]PLR94520.1 hypothetical protein CVD25_16415 [Bacillus canaveralius]RSK57525.1 hypothetical protein EJA13_00815 [Bacillus canaveralius]